LWPETGTGGRGLIDPLGGAEDVKCKEVEKLAKG